MPMIPEVTQLRFECPGHIITIMSNGSVNEEILAPIGTDIDVIDPLADQFLDLANLFVSPEPVDYNNDLECWICLADMFFVFNEQDVIEQAMGLGLILTGIQRVVA